MSAGTQSLTVGFAPSPLHWVRAALIAAPLAVMYFDTVLQLAVQWWGDADNSHGLLIPPLALYFAWSRRSELASAPVAPRLGAGLLLVLGALAGHFVGRLGSEFFLTRISFIPLAAGLLLFFFGAQHLKIVVFPLVFLALAVPVPALLLNTVSLPLQALVSRWGSGMLQVCSIPVLRDGNVLHLANGSLNVAEACSGLRSLISLVAMAAIIAYVRLDGWWRKTLLIALAVPVAVLMNMLRITGTGLIAGYWDLEYALGFYHSFSGWIMFLLALGLLYGAGALIERWRPLAPQTARATRGGG